MPSNLSEYISQMFSNLPHCPDNCDNCGGLSRDIKLLTSPVDFLGRSRGGLVGLCLDCFTRMVERCIRPDNILVDINNYISTFRCGDCGDLHIHYDMIRRNAWSFICHSCYERLSAESESNQSRCSLCNNRVDEEDLTDIAMDGCVCSICPQCYDSGQDVIHDYSYSPRFKYNRTGFDKREQLYYGIELEVEDTTEGDKLRAGVGLLPDYTYAKRDSSIACGFEIVTHPATYNWWLSQTTEWNNVLKQLGNEGFRSFNTDTCGMHIHLSKDAFSWLHLYKFMYFVYNPHNYNIIHTISQRNKRDLAMWANTENNKDMLYRKAIDRSNPYGRHTAVGMSHLNTVELRIFKGTLAPIMFWKNMEFTQALYEFSRDYSVRDMIWERLFDYIRCNNRFKNLRKILWGERIEREVLLFA